MLNKIKIDILPLAICYVVLIAGFIICLTSAYIFGTKQYLAVFLILVCSILYFLNKKIYFLAFGFVLTLGLFGIIDFYFRTYRVGFGDFGINPIYLGLLILFFFFSKSQMDKFFPEKNGKEKRTLNNNLIESFESQFKDKTITELNGIVSADSKYTAEAREAAKRILENKNVL